MIIIYFISAAASVVEQTSVLPLASNSVARLITFRYYSPGWDCNYYLPESDLFEFCCCNYFYGYCCYCYYYNNNCMFELYK